ncbi:MAG: DUF3549 family protein [Halobacteria archaeon]|nr:DUF3549 family protein [Halobacteria archaeon]
MTMQSLNDFLQQAGFNYVVYDMGRRMVQLTLQQFNQFENATMAYPTPLQQHAWLGIIGWQDDEKSQHFIWFLKLPLDELGKINPLARDELLHYLIEQLGQQLLTSEKTATTEIEPTALPHGFTPGEESMAMFHAKAAQHLGQPPSRFYEHARQYLSGEQGYDQWAFVGMQGLADVIVRLNQQDNQDLLQQALPHLPTQPFGQVCRYLEHETISPQLAKTIINRASNEKDPEHSRANVVASLRAIAGCPDQNLRRAFIRKVLAEEYARDIEVLAAISGRCWEDLKNDELCRLFLNTLAINTSGQTGFTHLLMDLLVIPGMRGAVMQCLRDPGRSKELAQAMGQFFSQLGA